MYISTKNSHRITTFYEYIVSMLYDFKIQEKPETVVSESIFIPAGYDNLQLLR
jgi:hypothetical protein